MKLIILDRDGVINEDSDHYIKSVDEWLPIPGSIEAIAKLSKSGFTIAVATNQSGIGRGYYSLDALDVMHSKMCTLVKNNGGIISGIFFCPHHPDEQCDCRKPKPGLVNQIEEAFNCNAKGSIFVGDSLKDLQVAVVKHCKPILVRTGKGERTLEKGLGELSNTPIFNNLAAVADAILKGEIK